MVVNVRNGYPKYVADKMGWPVNWWPTLVVDVAMDGLPARLNRALFAAMSGTTWVRPLLESAVVVFFA